MEKRTLGATGETLSRLPGTAGTQEHFFVTDASERFREVGERCLGRTIQRLELVDIMPGV